MFTLFIVCGTFVLADCLHVIARDFWPTRTLGNEFYDELFVRPSSAKELFTRITSRRPIKKREKTLRIPIQHAASCESVKRSIRRFHPRSLASTRRLRWRGELKSWTLTSPTEGGSISPFLFFLIHCNSTQSTLSLGTRPPCFLSFSRLTSVLASPDEWLEGLLIHYKLSPDE